MCYTKALCLWISLLTTYCFCCSYCLRGIDAFILCDGRTKIKSLLSSQQFQLKTSAGGTLSIRPSSSQNLSAKRSTENDENDAANENTKRNSKCGKVMDRRTSLLMSGMALAMTPMIARPSNVYAISETASLSTTVTDPDADADPPITHKVFFDVRISRSDGTFYVRDDPEGTIPTADNQVLKVTLTVGLFGTIAPNHVQQFLKYVDTVQQQQQQFRSGREIPSVYIDDEDSPLPSYSRCSFRSLDQSTGLLLGGYIPGLDVTEFAGSTALKYGGRILPASLWIERNKKENTDNNIHSLSHGAYKGKGLLTHRNLDVLPVFGITTRSSPELDATHTVFGRLLIDDFSQAFLDRIVDLPTYSMDRPAANTGVDVNDEKERATEAMASSIYAIQKDFFRSAAKTFGDTRLDKVYEGKLLRRVEVTRVGILES